MRGFDGKLKFCGSIDDIHHFTNYKKCLLSSDAIICSLNAVKHSDDAMTFNHADDKVWSKEDPFEISDEMEEIARNVDVEELN